MKSTPMRTPVLCLSLLALAACGKEQGPPKMPTPTVGVVEAQPQNAPLSKDLVGRLSAYRSGDVRARVSGLLLKRVYTEGTDVKQGQLMFQIDPAPYKAALAAAQAALASAQATYTNAHIVANRDRQLVPKGYISQAQMDTDEATERSSLAAVKQAEANVQTAQVNLNYTNITSPISGRAGEQQVTEGAIVGASTADSGSSSTLLTTVDQLDPMYVNFTLSAADLDTLQHAQHAGNVSLADQNKTTVEITLPSGNKYEQVGTLDYSSVIVNPTTGAINMRALVPNPQQRLLPGMYVTLTANMGELNKVFLIPQAGIQRDPAGAYALVVGKDGNVAQKRVSADNMRGNDWVVTSGLETGDQVIVSGIQVVKPGAPAKATPWTPDQAPAGQAPATAGHQ
ncbi:efflux RND transporter periplasmic adaptor subunit [Dyella caseinilytica]|uniref:Efflux RND transporter periplasmic adaptor subunit n=1 Tax=Dyella caseinilytica TaxID=1849581 RepID=A0ABX7GPJ1_9GAMM|nr:efflux RND transporter periplasmic adaptor subunit [Dyella caseinilytica]QRN52307.1 efflux RND transporter periplasmic adaptor subunit [Dyella caseinilytica]GGA14720.1 multidrug resistance protein [Dyella caseinilytica]